MNQLPRSIDAADLNEMLEEPRPPLLLDVRQEEYFNKGHLPEARNNCVFEVAFTERMKDAAPDLKATVCAYGTDAGSIESWMAGEKLVRSGHTDVLCFKDGIEAWRAAGFPVEGHPGEVEEPKVADGTRMIDSRESRIRWIGRNLLNHHEGFIGIRSCSLNFEAGEPSSGRFVIDMRAIRCSDLEGNAMHDVLIHHLLGHDFFESATFPEAIFEIKKAARIPDAAPGTCDLSTEGELTLKGICLPLVFDACTGITAEGKPAAQATLSFDLTLWNVFCGSGKWFRNPEGHLVNDLIEPQLRIVGT